MITIKRDNEQLRIYFDDILHLYIKMNDLIGIQSWIDINSGGFFIEYYFSTGPKITCNYNVRTRWTEMLKLLEQNITMS